ILTDHDAGARGWGCEGCDLFVAGSLRLQTGRLGWLNHAAYKRTAPNSCKMIRITAMTSRMWMRLPTLGILGLIDAPKKPSSHRIRRMTTIVHNMIFSFNRHLYWILSASPPELDFESVH